MELDAVVRGGTVTTADSSFIGDVGIVNGKIAAIGPELTAHQVFDATGRVVMPGAIDVHTHFETNVGEHGTADDYESGSRAAAVGGITTFINFAFQLPGHPLHEAVEAEYRKAEGKSYLDFGIHVVITDTKSINLDSSLQRLVATGVTSLKIFTAIDSFELDQRSILQVLHGAARHQMIVAVHAEDGALISHLTSNLLREGKTSVEYLTQARPPEAEAIAMAMVAEYAAATQCPVYFVHLSSRKALDVVRNARSQGTAVFVETRPAYLFLDSSRYCLPGQQGNKFVTWPPLRTLEDQEALWNGLRSGEIQTYATDHTTWMEAEKMQADMSFDQIPGGISNVQTSIGMLYNEGVKKGRISLNRFVEVCSTNPAKLFGMWPQKGSIAIGSDADLTILDPAKPVRIVSSEMQSRSDFDPYDSWVGEGWPVATFSRGELVALDGQIVAEPGRGRHLSRLPFHSL